MRIQFTLYIAETKINDYMEKAGFRTKKSLFITHSAISCKQYKTFNKGIFLNLFETSLNRIKQNGYWIPAVGFAGSLIVYSEIDELYIGKERIFLRESLTKENKEQEIKEETFFESYSMEDVYAIRSSATDFV